MNYIEEALKLNQLKLNFVEKGVLSDAKSGIESLSEKLSIEQLRAFVDDMSIALSAYDDAVRSAAATIKVWTDDTTGGIHYEDEKEA